MRFVVTLSLATLASAFTLSPALPRSCASARPLGAPPAAALQPSRSPAPAMGLFGLGWPELGVIGVAGLFLFGPERLAGLAKDLGKQSAGLKEVAESFQEGCAYSGADSTSLARGRWGSARAHASPPPAQAGGGGGDAQPQVGGSGRPSST